MLVDVHVCAQEYAAVERCADVTKGRGWRVEGLITARALTPGTDAHKFEPCIANWPTAQIRNTVRVSEKEGKAAALQARQASQGTQGSGPPAAAQLHQPLVVAKPVQLSEKGLAGKRVR